VDKIIIRDDDVLVGSSSIKDTFKRFKRVHELICRAPKHLIHVPNILVEEIQEFPDCIEYIKVETKAGRMRPELHGYQHIDYGKLSSAEVKLHLSRAACWFKVQLDYYPTKWYTPWGASQPHLHEAAKLLGLKLIDKSKKTNGRYGIVQEIRNGHKLSDFNEIGIHWWKGRDIENLEWLVEQCNGSI